MKCHTLKAVTKGMEDSAIKRGYELDVYEN